MKSLSTTTGGLLLGWLVGTALAHTTVSVVTPADGAELDAPPAVIEIQFEHAVHLTSVVLLEPGTQGRNLEFSPHGSSEVFRVEHPDLARGRNEIRWKALSSDGHVISGTLTYVVRSTQSGVR